jgi:hypothetical protein
MRRISALVLAAQLVAAAIKAEENKHAVDLADLTALGTVLDAGERGELIAAINKASGL